MILQAQLRVFLTQSPNRQPGSGFIHGACFPSLFLIIITCLVLSQGIASAQGGAIVTWHSPTTAHLGKVKAGEQKQAVFEFSHSAPKPLVIDNVRTTCGCTAPEWPEEPLAPGIRRRIRVVFEGTTRGPFRRMVKVYFSGQRQAEKLYVEGFVE